MGGHPAVNFPSSAIISRGVTAIRFARVIINTPLRSATWTASPGLIFEITDGFRDSSLLVIVFMLTTLSDKAGVSMEFSQAGEGGTAPNKQRGRTGFSVGFAPIPANHEMLFQNPAI